MPITITDNGIVLVLRQTEGGNHRVSINPGDMNLAESILEREELAQVEKVWTTNVIAAWQESVEEWNERIASVYNQGDLAEVTEITVLRSEVEALKAEIATLKGQMTEITTPINKVKV